VAPGCGAAAARPQPGNPGVGWVGHPLRVAAQATCSPIPVPPRRAAAQAGSPDGPEVGVPSGNAVVVGDGAAAAAAAPTLRYVAAAAAAGEWSWTGPPSLSSISWTPHVRSDCSNLLPKNDDLAILLQRKRGSPSPASRVASPGAPWAKKPPTGRSRVRRKNLGCASRAPLVIKLLGPPLALGRQVSPHPSSALSAPRSSLQTTPCPPPPRGDPPQAPAPPLLSRQCSRRTN
jgi:hypothetical protein